MNNPPNPPHPRGNVPWFPSVEEMSKAAKKGGVFTKPTAPSPEQHLQDVTIQTRTYQFDMACRGRPIDMPGLTKAANAGRGQKPRERDSSLTLGQCQGSIDRRCDDSGGPQ